MKIANRSRRMFLQGAGSTMVAIPFLQSLLPRSAWAQTPSVVKRFISVSSAFDYGAHSNMYPQMTRPSLALNIPGHHTVNYARLTDYMNDGRTKLSRIIVPELTPYLNQMNIYRGLDFACWFGHGYGNLLGNIAGVDNNVILAAMPNMLTIDQVINNNRTFNPGALPVALLGNLGRQVSYGYDASKNIVPVNAPATNPLQAYRTLFNNDQYPETGGAVTVNPRSDVLSRVLEDYNKIRNGRQISSVDKTVLDNAFDQLSDVHRGISGQIASTASCHYKGMDTTSEGDRYDAATSLKNYAKIMVAAMMCDVSRVFTFAGAIDDAKYNRNPDPNVGFHHGVTHEPFLLINGTPNFEYMGDIQAQYMRYFMAPLLDAMSAAVDPANGKSYLNNSLVHYSSEHPTLHGWQSMPAVTFGNAGGSLRTGNYIDCTDWSKGYRNVEGWSGKQAGDEGFSQTTYGVSYNRIFVTIMQAMGLSPSDYENPSINTNFNGRTDSLYGAINNNISNIGGYGYITVPTPESQGLYFDVQYLEPLRNLNLQFFKSPLPSPS